jgi:hypothetical protein
VLLLLIWCQALATLLTQILLLLLLLLQFCSPHAAMTLVPRFTPLPDCTSLSRHSITRSSLAFSSTSLHERSTQSTSDQ